MSEQDDSRQAGWIPNCEFAFECPKRWQDLQATEDPHVRHCTSCERSVHLCQNQRQLEGHIAEGHCVAIRFGTDSERGLLIKVGQPDTPYYTG